MDDLFNRDAEELLLARLLMNPANFELVKDLQPADFGVYGWMFNLLRDEYHRHGSYSLSGLRKLMSEQGQDPDAVSDFLKSSMAGSVSIDGCVFEIKGYAKRRKAMEIAYNVLSLVTDRSQKHDAPIEAIQSLAGGLVDDSAITPIMDVISRMVTHPSREYSPTGVRRLDDRMSGGLYRGKLYGFSGPEKGGKTMLASTISYNLAEKGIEHLYVAMEMGEQEITERMLARKNGFNSLQFLKTRPDVSKLKPITNMFFLDAPGITLQELESKLLSAVVKLNIKGAIIDYWQLIQGQRPGESEEKHLREVAQALANFARKQNIWILLLSQSNQEGKTFAGRGLVKACDQLYMIHFCENDPSCRWLEMAASRYTMRENIGDKDDPSFRINPHIGPYFEEI